MRSPARLLVALLLGGAVCVSCQDTYDFSNGVFDPSTCSDGVLDDQETDIDCGGPECSPCLGGRTCMANSDCISGVCAMDCSFCFEGPTCDGDGDMAVTASPNPPPAALDLSVTDTDLSVADTGAGPGADDGGEGDGPVDRD